LRWTVAEPGKTKVAGYGEHGGWGPDETRPFLAVEHERVAPAVLTHATSFVDIAPTMLDFLGVPFETMDGTSLLRVA
jgi:arylsulfatase A-like enzyme